MAELREFLDPATVAQLESLEVVARRVVEGFLRGLHASPAKGSSMEFAEHRPYVPGDDLRHVDWRGFAKTDRHYLKQFEDETNLRATLILDVSESMAFGSIGVSKLRYACCLAAALGWLLLRQRDAIGLALADEDVHDYVPPKATAGHLAGIFSAMQSVRTSGRTRLGRVLHRMSERMHRRSLAIVVSDFLDDVDEVLTGISQVRQNGSEVFAIHLMDPAEIELPFTNWMVFRDMEDPSTEVRLDAREIESIYRANLTEHREALRKGCAAAGVDYLFVRTNEPFETALGRYLHLRARRRR